MNHLARKKIVLVIVEGASDDTALGVALNQVFDKDSVYIHIMHGDITTRKGVNPQNTQKPLKNNWLNLPTQPFSFGFFLLASYFFLKKA